ncbi:galactose oxidase early set domain-containing protein [Streptomyces sp. ZAF1911]|uniref:galactose oxidase early set domain-containing protein n=1 Tax=Streptomyces sp. ZAF1911 TaxID=2944129 RepID=UPI00237B9BC3|nr:galactose oxidase early set domain-containing protein [Streptomyces sp. ZAF1911]MDD9381284.1 galactose oxidase early set domain-containing protein [Streptomyces sp. ZAF1911]
MPWKILRERAEILAVHAAFMGFGKIVYFGGDQHDPKHNEYHQIDATRLFDCTTSQVTTLASPDFDVFCCGQAFLESEDEVQLLVAGGTERFIYPENPPSGEPLHFHHGHFPGLRDAAVLSSPKISDPNGPGWTWRPVASMHKGITRDHGNPDLTGGRWYPTLVTLHSGSVMAFSGHPGSGDQAHNNDLPEEFSRTPEPKGTWRRLPTLTDSSAHTYYSDHGLPLYPRMHVLPYGGVVCTNPLKRPRDKLPPRLQAQTSDRMPATTLAYLPDALAAPLGGLFAPLALFPTADDAASDYGGYSSSSVLLPLGQPPADPGLRNASKDYVAHLMVCGGINRQPYRLDLTGWQPGASAGSWDWKPTGPRAIQQRRMHANATILPTGEILLTGGINDKPLDIPEPPPPPDIKAVHTPELYNPYLDKWTVLDGPEERLDPPRNYHSVALLMPDGRVWSAGGNDNAATSDADAVPPHDDRRNLDIGLFEPWYHGHPDRPYITAAPSLACPGETIAVETTFASQIDRVVLVRCGSSTHSFNPDQRLVELAFEYVGGRALRVRMAPDNHILPPGPYLLFTLKELHGTPGLPSTGADIYVVPPRQQ